MRPCSRIATPMLFCFGVIIGAGTAYGQQEPAAAKPEKCAQLHIDDKASTALRPWAQPSDRSCTVRAAHGLQLPDAKCTPGAFNPTVTLQILRQKFGLHKLPTAT